MDPKTPWPAKPEQYEPLVKELAKKYPNLVRLDTIVQPTGHTVYAISVTDWQVPPEGKRVALFDVPHAHEPGATVGALRMMHQLLTGEDLDGVETSMDCRRALRTLVLCFIPDANPAGRARAPEDAWDGTRYTNDEFLKIAFGIEGSTGERFPRPDRWKEGDYEVEQLGIVWEPLGEGVYVEPNRHHSSSLARLVARLRKRHELDRRLSLHQTEFENSPNNCMVMLPIIQEELPKQIRDLNTAWGEEVVAAWVTAGYEPRLDVKPLGYGADQRAYFVQTWKDLYERVPDLTSEVQNNNVRTPPHDQQRMTQIAIRVTIEGLLR